MILPFPNLFLFRVLRILAVMACVVACTVVALDFLSPDPQFRMHGGIYNPLDIFRDFGLGLAGIFLLVFMVVAMLTFPKYRRLGMFWPRLLPKIDPHPGRHS